MYLAKLFLPLPLPIHIDILHYTFHSLSFISSPSLIPRSQVTAISSDETPTQLSAQTNVECSNTTVPYRQTCQQQFTLILSSTSHVRLHFTMSQSSPHNNARTGNSTLPTLPYTILENVFSQMDDLRPLLLINKEINKKICRWLYS